MTNQNYPGVIERVKAMVTDSIVIIVFMFIASYVFSFFESVPDNARILAFVFIVLFYDPVFTSVLGGTIGHIMLGIRVRRASNEQKNIIFPLAVLRYIVKSSLGLISLLTVSNNKKRRAIHDLLVGSVVVYAESQE